MRLEDLGLIGNCQISALVERSGAIVWSCLPRFDSEPVFSTLLDEAGGGSFTVASADGRPGEIRYLENTNVLETTFRGSDGAFRVLDFAPRFLLHDRVFRPTQILRIVEPLEGAPRVRIACEPRLGWSKEPPPVVEGSHHLEFGGFARRLRLTTDVPLSYLGQRPFALTQRQHLALTWGAPIEEPLAPLCDRFLGETVRHWQQWVKQCNIPPFHQSEVIRSALALKLHCFEDTGAIVAAMTTSIPEAPGSGRNWDYRYCWLRDAYYALAAFRSLGHFEEREQFVRYLLEIAAGTADLALAPLYRIDGGTDLDERIVEGWSGYLGERPVRSGNGAAAQSQNDIFGELVLALTPVFLDDRFREERSKSSLDLLLRLARKAVSVAGTPDAGIWEYRTPGQIRTFSTLMCWAAADRMAAVAARQSPALEAEFREAASRIRDRIVEGSWNPRIGAFVGTHGGEDLDASLLQMATLRFLPGDDPRLRQTVATIRDQLTAEGWLLRYRLDDGFGQPKAAFVICTFWLIEALAATGRIDEARAAMDRARGALSPLGLLSEDYEPATLRMWGNFPQAYSHVGLIQAAFAASPRWSEVL
ncbi:MAG TPA: glycoside hydrolase family 15 protein [Thermoanaerobaculia bacterium]|nr:glycoside hydrolase family 15 protein [Thermoanaerobaculia bacterium]